MNALQHVLLDKVPFAVPENILKGITLEQATKRPLGAPHSLYEELWHIQYWLRFSLSDIRGENPVVPAHSTESFPADNDTLTEDGWQRILKEVSEDLKNARDLAGDTQELGRKFKPDKTVRDELMVIAAHNAYHFGRMVLLRQLLGIWSKELGDSW